MKRTGFRHPALPRAPRQPLVVPEVPPAPRATMPPALRFYAPVTKLEIVRSKPYLKEVAKLRCFNCGAVGCSQAAHPNSLAAGGSGGGKASDILTFPLCCERARNCHREFDHYRLVPKADMPGVEERWAAETQMTLILLSQEPGKEAAALRRVLVAVGLVR